VRPSSVWCSYEESHNVVEVAIIYFDRYVAALMGHDGIWIVGVSSGSGRQVLRYKGAGVI
jgi:nitrogen fixation protein FixH